MRQKSWPNELKVERSIISMQLERGRSISQKYLSAFTDDEIAEFLEEIFDHYRKVGLPFYSYTWRQKQNMFDKLSGLKANEMINDNVVIQNFCSQGLAWSYFPHVWSIPCGTFKTVVQTYRNDERFKKALERVIKVKGMISNSNLKSFIVIARGTQAVSNFRPSAAKAIYHKYALGKVVWDMSCGFGGRLLGALTCPVAKYIGTDPGSETFAGLEKMKAELQPLSFAEVYLNKRGSEEFIPAEKVDLCFTSPPYFDTERYSDEPTQSYRKYPTMHRWLNGFVMQTVLNCREAIKPDGHLILNISPKLEEPFVALCDKAGFRLADTLQLEMTQMPGRSKGAKVIRKKYEPILVFKKR